MCSADGETRVRLSTILTTNPMIIMLTSLLATTRASDAWLCLSVSALTQQFVKMGSVEGETA